MTLETRTASLAGRGEEGRARAMARFAVLRPHLEEGVPLARAAGEAGVPPRTAQRWLARYRRDGLAGLARPVRSDAGAHRAPSELVALVEGLGLKRPRSSAAAIHRRVRDVATARGWRAPSYGTVHAILSRLDPAMVTLAQDGPAAYRDRYELIHRHRAGAPNALWQADHTLLDVLVLDGSGEPARPWLTTVVDDHSRAVAGYMVFLGAPSVLNTCLALRHAIWRKADPPGRSAACRTRSTSTTAATSPAAISTRSRPRSASGGLLRRRAAAGPGQGRAAVRHAHHRAAAGAARPSRRRQAGHAAPPVARGAGPERGRLHRRHLPRPPPRRDRPSAARRLARPRLRSRACPRPWKSSTCSWSCTPGRVSSGATASASRIASVKRV